MAQELTIRAAMAMATANVPFYDIPPRTHNFKTQRQKKKLQFQGARPNYLSSTREKTNPCSCSFRLIYNSQFKTLTTNRDSETPHLMKPIPKELKTEPNYPKRIAADLPERFGIMNVRKSSRKSGTSGGNSQRRVEWTSSTTVDSVQPLFFFLA